MFLYFYYGYNTFQKNINFIKKKILFKYLIAIIFNTVKFIDL